MGPDRLFRKVLENMMDDGIVEKVLWATAPTLAGLRQAMGVREPNETHTHKRDLHGVHWGLKLVSAYGVTLGVDLEIQKDRPILQQPEWLWERLGRPMSKDKLNSEGLLKEWTEREAAFKVVGGDVLLSSFVRKSEKLLSLFEKGEERTLEVRSWRQNEWVLALAWRYM